MATHAYIMDGEEKLIQARNAVKGLIEAYDGECARNGGMIQRENRDVWGTTHVNAHALLRELQEFIGRLDQKFQK